MVGGTGLGGRICLAGARRERKERFSYLFRGVTSNLPFASGMTLSTLQPHNGFAN